MGNNDNDNNNSVFRFLAELFKLKMLVEAIMHDCIFKLLKNGDEDSLKCMCCMMYAIGKDLDNEKAKVNLELHTRRT